MKTFSRIVIGVLIVGGIIWSSWTFRYTCEACNKGINSGYQYWDIWICDPCHDIYEYMTDKRWTYKGYTYWDCNRKVWIYEAITGRKR